jgi:hypothetical protein
VTPVLREALPKDCQIIASDLNDPMLEVARAKLRDETSISFRVVNAMEIPMEAASVDVITCQFGVVFSLLALAIAGTPAQAVSVGAVYAGDFGGPRIFEYTPGLPPPVTSPVGPGLSSGVPVGGLAFDPTTGLLLVCESFDNHVEMLDPTTGRRFPACS